VVNREEGTVTKKPRIARSKVLREESIRGCKSLLRIRPRPWEVVSSKTPTRQGKRGGEKACDVFLESGNVGNRNFEKTVEKKKRTCSGILSGTGRRGEAFPSAVGNLRNPGLVKKQKTCWGGIIRADKKEKMGNKRPPRYFFRPRVSVGGVLDGEESPLVSALPETFHLEVHGGWQHLGTED